MKIGQIISNFPKEWISLMKIVCCERDYLHQSDTYLKGKDQSSFGLQLHWTTLLEALCQKEPFTEANQLKFKARFHHFPQLLQQRILNFVHHNKRKFVRKNLRNFCELLQKSQTDGEGWISVILRHIHIYCEQNTDCGENESKRPSTTCPVYHKFSACNERPLKNVYSLIQSRATYQPWCCDSSSSETPIMTQSSDIVGPGSQATGPVLEEQDDIIVLEDSMHLDNDLLTQGLEPSAKKRKIQDDDCRGNNSSPVSAVSAENQVVLKDLMNRWSNQQIVEVARMNIFTTCGQSEMDEMCKVLNLDTAPVDVAVAACRDFVSLQQDVSCGSATVFARQCMLPHIIALKQETLRTLLSMIKSFTKVYPLASIDGMLVPLSTNKEAGSIHSEFLSVVLKEKFFQEHRKQYLLAYLQKRVPLTVSMIPVLQIIIDAKDKIDGGPLDMMVVMFEANALEMMKNMQFLPLVRAFIVQSSRELQPHHITSLKATVETNKSFVKKSCLTILNKL